MNLGHIAAASLVPLNETSATCIYDLKPINGWTGPVIQFRSFGNTFVDFFYFFNTATNKDDLYTTNSDNTTSTAQQWAVGTGSSPPWVSCWYDQSGNGRNATQAEPTLMPFYATATFEVYFAQINSHLALPVGCFPSGESSISIRVKGQNLVNTQNTRIPVGLRVGSTNLSSLMLGQTSTSVGIFFTLRTNVNLQMPVNLARTLIYKQGKLFTWNLATGVAKFILNGYFVSTVTSALGFDGNDANEYVIGNTMNTGITGYTPSTSSTNHRTTGVRIYNTDITEP